MDIHSEAFLNSLMRRQFRLSVFCAALFMTGLFGLPLANYYLPDLMATRIWGFTLSWLILGVGFFPAVWVIAWVFIRRSMELEANEVAGVQAGQRVAAVRPAREAQAALPEAAGAAAKSVTG